MEDVRIFLTTPGEGTWTVPADCTSATIECIGGGAAGYYIAAQGGYYPHGAGGGGAYAKKNSLTLSPGSSVSYSVGIGGAAVYSTLSPGGDTWFKSTSDVLAKGGSAPSGQAGRYFTGGAGGQAAACVGDVVYSGGNGNSTSGSTSYAPGGGGAAGLNGVGLSGITTTFATMGGVGDNNYGGVGGYIAANKTRYEAGNGTEWDSTHGSGGGGSGSSYVGGGVTLDAGGGGLYGGGGGGGNAYGANKMSGSGAQGIIVITYTPVVAGSSKFFQLF